MNHAIFRETCDTYERSTGWDLTLWCGPIAVARLSALEVTVRYLADSTVFITGAFTVDEDLPDTADPLEDTELTITATSIYGTVFVRNLWFPDAGEDIDSATTFAYSAECYRPIVADIIGDVPEPLFNIQPRPYTKEEFPHEGLDG